MNSSTRAKLTRFPARPEGSGSIDHPRPERLVQGNPRRETWNLVEAKVPAGKVYSGIWRCEPGRWRIQMEATEQELFTVTAGRCRVHDVNGGFEEAGVGDAIHIPPGFTGEFEVLEPLTKTYMILE